MVIEHQDGNSLGSGAEVWSRISGSFGVWCLGRKTVGEHTGLGACIKNLWYNAAFWFALPISIWLAEGWTGLPLHWQAIDNGDKAPEDLLNSQPVLLFENLSPSLTGETSCVAMKNETL